MLCPSILALWIDKIKLRHNPPLHHHPHTQEKFRENPRLCFFKSVQPLGRALDKICHAILVSLLSFNRRSSPERSSLLPLPCPALPYPALPHPALFCPPLSSFHSTLLPAAWYCASKLLLMASHLLALTIDLFLCCAFPLKAAFCTLALKKGGHE